MSKREQFKNIKGRHEITDEPDQRPYGGLSDDLLGELAKAKNKSKKEIANTLRTSDIRTGVFKWTSTGLQVEGEITKSDWEHTGHALKFMNNAIQFLIGDWVAYGEGLGYGDHEEFAEQFGYEVNSLYNMKWVATKVEISLRREILSFGHHKVVAGLDETQQSFWLEKADTEDMSVKALREALKESEPKQLSVADLIQKQLKSEIKKAKAMIDDGIKPDHLASMYEQLAEMIRKNEL